MMLCFDVFLNGKRLCRAAVGEAGVLTTIVSWAEGAAAKPRRGAYGRDRLNLHVGGLYHPDEETNIHPRWVDRSLRLGDRVTIRIVEASHDGSCASLACVSGGFHRQVWLGRSRLADRTCDLSSGSGQLSHRTERSRFA